MIHKERCFFLCGGDGRRDVLLRGFGGEMIH